MASTCSAPSPPFRMAGVLYMAPRGSLLLEEGMVGRILVGYREIWCKIVDAIDPPTMLIASKYLQSTGRREGRSCDTIK